MEAFCINTKTPTYAHTKELTVGHSITKLNTEESRHGTGVEEAK